MLHGHNLVASIAAGWGENRALYVTSLVRRRSVLTAVAISSDLWEASMPERYAFEEVRAMVATAAEYFSTLSVVEQCLVLAASAAVALTSVSAFVYHEMVSHRHHARRTRVRL